MKKFFKFASYTLLYIFVTFVSAFGVVFLSSNDTGNGQDDGFNIPPQIMAMVEKMTATNALDINMNAQIETESDKYNIELKALINKEQGFEINEVQGSLLVYINDDKLIADINYQNGTIFMDMFNGKFKIETSSIGESINKVLELLNIEIPELGIDLSRLDPEMILSMLSNITETKKDDYVTLKIDLPIVGNLEIEMLCSLDYSIYQVSIPPISIDGTNLSLFTNIDYPDHCEIENLEYNDYINITDVVDIADSLLNYLNEDNMEIDIEVEFEDYNFKGMLSANLKELNSKFTTSILGYDLNLLAIDNIIYFELGNIKFSYSLEKMNLISDLLMKHFGIEVPIEEISKILVSINNGNLIDTISKLFPDSTTSTRLDSIDLSILEDFSRDGNNYTFSLKDIGNVSCVIENGEFKKAQFSGFGVNASIASKNAEPIELNSPIEAYNSLENTLPAIDAMLSMKDCRYFEGSMNASFGEENMVIDYIFAINDNNISASISTTLFNKPLNIRLIDNEVFFDFSNVKAKVVVGDVPELLDFIENTFDIHLSENLILFIKDLINPELYTNLINSIETGENSTIITLLDNIKLTLHHNEVITGFDVVSENFNISASLLASNKTFECDIVKEEFIDVNELVKAMINTTAFDDYELTGTLQIKLNIFNINIKVPFDIKLKMVDGAPEIMATIGTIPVIVGANDDTPYEFGNTGAGKNRMAYAYYKDEFLYIYRTEDVPTISGKSKTYERKIKAHYTDFLADPMTYLQFITGFSDSIIGEINKAIIASQNRENPIDFGNIIKEFSLSDNADEYIIKLNLAELANNAMLDTLTLSIKTTEDVNTGKNYVTGATLNLFMPFTNSLNMSLVSDDISLINIGQELNFEKLYEYVSSYPIDYKENEMWHAINGNWIKQKDKSYTIIFEENGGDEVSDITATYGAEIALPILAKRFEFDYENKLVYTYIFEGWYSDQTFSPNSYADFTTMPRFGATLYAKWSDAIVEDMKEITFEMQGGYAIDKAYAPANSTFDTSIYSPARYRDAEKIKYDWGKAQNEWRVTRYTFAGWYLDADYTTAFDGKIENNDLTIYAKWEANVYTEYYVTWKEPD